MRRSLLLLTAFTWAAASLNAQTPLSGTPLYEVIVQKSKAAARAHGLESMYPVLIMVSEETERETEEFFKARQYFGEAERIRGMDSARQQTF